MVVAVEDAAGNGAARREGDEIEVAARRRPGQVELGADQPIRRELIIIAACRPPSAPLGLVESVTGVPKNALVASSPENAKPACAPTWKPVQMMDGGTLACGGGRRRSAAPAGALSVTAAASAAAHAIVLMSDIPTPPQ
jgi:hypothetical protein